MASSESERRSRVSVAVKVKTSSNGEVRRFRLEEEDNKDLFDTLVSRIRSLLGSEMIGRVSYVDGDGDVVAMESTEEVLEAIRLSPSVLTILWREDETAKEKGGQVTHHHPSCSSASSSSSSSSSFASSSSYNAQGYVDSHQMHQQLMTSSSDDDDDDSDNSEKEERGGKGNAKELERFEKKKAKIEAKMAKLREKEMKEKDERGEKKMAKLQRKLDLLEEKRENPKKRKGVKESDSNVSKKIFLENQLSRIQKTKTKNDKKIHKFRGQLTELDGAPNKGIRVDRLREKLADLEDRQNCLIAQEREVERQLQPFALAV